MTLTHLQRSPDRLSMGQPHATHPSRSETAQHWSDVTLNDRTYYSLQLSRRLSEYLALNQDTLLGDTSANSIALLTARLLVAQAYHLMVQGHSEKLTEAQRQAHYGNDHEIAELIVMLQSELAHQNTDDSHHRECCNDRLQQIAIKAHLTAVNTPITEDKRCQILEFVERRFGLTLAYRKYDELPIELGTKVTDDPAFIEQCQQMLTYYVGPVAPFLIDTLIQEQPHLGQQEFVERLATYIKLPKQATQFCQRLTDQN